jgi:hypothetical protein
MNYRSATNSEQKVSSQPQTETGTTTFTAQNPVNVNDRQVKTSHNLDLVNSSITGFVDQGLASFMEKPLIMASADLLASNLAGTLLFRFDIGSQLTSQPMWNLKTNGFMNFRGTAVVRLQVNANPFQAGRLILGYLPNYKHNSRSMGQHLSDLCSITQIPHVEMSLQDTECVLEIPYVAPTTHYNKLSGYYDWGSVFCFVYSPLVTGAASPNSAQYTCWMSFDNFEFEVPVVANSGTIKGQRGVIRKYAINKKSTLDKEVNEGTGPISSVLSSVSSVASSLAAVPFLAPIAGPSAWCSNLLAGVASSFGYSKPALDTQLTRVVENYNAYLCNSNVTDTNQPLSLFVDNKVSIMPDVGASGLDEMSINFIKKQKAFIRSTVWRVVDVPGLLQRIECNPFSIGNTLPTNHIHFGPTQGADVKSMPPIELLGRMFDKWRGSIVLTIKIIKTKFHTGRLLVAFDPYGFAGLPTLTGTAYLHREIIDLRDGDEFVIRVPYANNTMYLETDDVSTTNSKPCVNVFILNELRAPETAAQTVEVIIEAHGGDDLEFQCPKMASLVPVDLINPQSGDDSEALILTHDIGNSTIHDPSSQASQLCVGEHVTSVLQLLKRYVRLSLASNLSALQVWTLQPFISGMPAPSQTGPGFAYTKPPSIGDYIALFGSMYAHSRGGIRLKILNNSTTSPVQANLIDFLSTVSVESTSGYTPGYTYDGIATTTAANLPDQFDAEAGVTGTSNGVTVQVPQYTSTYTRLNYAVTTNQTAATLQFPDVSRYTVGVRSFSNFGIGSAFRAVADDWQYSTWIGVPPLVIKFYSTY